MIKIASTPEPRFPAPVSASYGYTQAMNKRTRIRLTKYSQKAG